MVEEQARLFGAQLRRLREQAELSLVELARRTHYSKGYLSNVENGKKRATAELAHSCDRALDTDGLLIAMVPDRVRPGPKPKLGVVPRQLPAHTPYFVGRQQELRQLSTVLSPVGDGRTAVISAVGGTAGIGKTALALHWAYRVQAQFPDGQLYANLQRADPGSVLGGFLLVLGVSAAAIPAELEARAALYRELLAQRRMLVVLDNARDADQARPLLFGGPSCLVVVTSRDRLDGLVAKEGAHRVTLGLPAAAEAVDLLAERIGRDRIDAEPAATAELVELCARLPLALSIVAARAAAHPRFGLGQLVAELRDAGAQLDGLDLGDADLNLRAVFSWSYHHLGSASARLFRLLGGHPGPDLDVHAAAALAGCSLAQARRWLHELVRAHLVEEHRPARFRFHDLLQVYAAEQAESDREAAQLRLLDHYLHSAYAANRLLRMQQPAVDLDEPRPGAGPRQFTDYAAALGWCDTEHPVLLASIASASASGRHSQAWQLSWALAHFLHRRGHWQDWIWSQQLALDSAGQLGDLAAKAAAHRSLAYAHRLVGRLDDALGHCLRALEVCRKLGDRKAQANAHRSLAQTYNWLGRYEEAVAEHHRALTLHRETDDRIGEANCRNGLGWAYAHLGNYEEALAHCQQALILNWALGDHDGEAATLDSLGYINHQLGCHDEAASHYRRSSILFRKLGDHYREATTLDSLGDALLACGDRDPAVLVWRESLAILERLGHADAKSLQVKLNRVVYSA